MITFSDHSWHLAVFSYGINIAEPHFAREGQLGEISIKRVAYDVQCLTLMGKPKFKKQLRKNTTGI